MQCRFSAARDMRDRPPGRLPSLQSIRHRIMCSWSQGSRCSGRPARPLPDARTGPSRTRQPRPCDFFSALQCADGEPAEHNSAVTVHRCSHAEHESCRGRLFRFGGDGKRNSAGQVLLRVATECINFALTPVALTWVSRHELCASGDFLRGTVAARRKRPSGQGHRWHIYFHSDPQLRPIWSAGKTESPRTRPARRSSSFRACGVSVTRSRRRSLPRPRGGARRVAPNATVSSCRTEAGLTRRACPGCGTITRCRSGECVPGQSQCAAHGERSGNAPVQHEQQHDR